MADNDSHHAEEIPAMINSPKIQESPEAEMPGIVRIGLEASRVATEKMLDFYKRMGIEVTPQMTLVKPQGGSTREDNR